jgi:hypothetical protein
MSARIIADSINPAGNRITTLVVRFPRFILAEWNTHRQFSRHAASSRAIPTTKIIDQVCDGVPGGPIMAKVPRIIKVYPDLAGAPGVGDDPDNADFSYVWGSPVMACLYGIDVKAPARFGGRPDLVMATAGSQAPRSLGRIDQVVWRTFRTTPAAP